MSTSKRGKTMSTKKFNGEIDGKPVKMIVRDKGYKKIWLACMHILKRLKRLRKPRINRNGFLTALYSGIGGFLLLFTLGLWSEGLAELRMPSTYHLTIADGIELGVLSFIGAVPIYIVTHLFHARRKRHQMVNPSIPSTLNALFVAMTYLIVAFLAIENETFTGFVLLFVLSIVAIIGWSTYLSLPPENVQFGSVKSKKEALTLEHEWILRLVNILVWAVAILALSAWLVTWIEFVKVEPQDISTPSFVKISASTTIQAIYLCIGIWFGIIGKQLARTKEIHREISKLKL